MSCSELKRTCGDFPNDITLPNISGVTFEGNATSVTMRWEENATEGNTYITVVNMVTGDRVGYYVVPYLSPSASVVIELDSEDTYGIAYWKEDGAGGRSEIASLTYDFLTNPEASQVLHNTVGVIHNTDLVIHTRQQIYLVQEGTESDYLLTESLGFTISG